MWLLMSRSKKKIFENELEGSDWGTARGCYGAGLESLVFNSQPSGSYGIIKYWQCMKEQDGGVTWTPNCWYSIVSMVSVAWCVSCPYIMCVLCCLIASQLHSGLLQTVCLCSCCRLRHKLALKSLLLTHIYKNTDIPVYTQSSYLYT